MWDIKDVPVYVREGEEKAGRDRCVVFDRRS